ncbi:MAG: YlmC/YmxH family sporulation protein [Clostridia bacterium]|nr:YlmC/YmxH family sporulation protein [Clostridia bacterium]
MLRSCDLRQKEVINIRTAERIGYIEDVDIDFETGRILSVIIPKHRIFFLKRDDFVIPWESIVHVGRELILVDYCELIED